MLAQLLIIVAFFSGKAFTLFSCSNLPAEYDLGNLTKPKFWSLNNVACFDQSESNCEIFFTFCNVLPTFKECSNSSVCQYDQYSNLTKLADFNESPFYTKEDFNGFYAVFSGPTIFNKLSNKPCDLSVVFEFDCDKNEYWNSTVEDQAPAPAPVVYNGITDLSCQIYLKFKYAGACHRIVPPTTTEINPTPSKICIPPKGGYDISTLTYPPYWQFNITSGCAIEPTSKSDACILSVAFCKPLEEVGCAGASACIRYPNDPGSTIIAGNYSEDPFDSFVSDQFSADYPGGETITNRFTGKTCLPSVSIVFVCDRDYEWSAPEDNEPGLVPKINQFSSISSQSCQMNITVPYKGACVHKKDDSSSISTGSILLIIVFVSVLVYLLVGSGYNKLVEKQAGLQLIPHYKFWSTSLLFALEGFIFAWRFLTCQRKKNKLLKYDAI